MNHRAWAVGSALGLASLACQAVAATPAPSAERSARPQASRVQPGRVQADRTAAQRAQAPRTPRASAGSTPRRAQAAPRSRAQGSQSNSEAVASSEGGIGVGSQSLSVDNHSRGAASTAIAPPLVSSNDTCMGAASVGAAGMAFGLSLGKTYVDDNCVLLKNSRELWNMGYRGAAIARMCMDPLNREALETSGVRCPAAKKSTVAQAPVSPEVTAHDPAFR